MGRERGERAAWARVLRAGLDVLVPVQCAGCGAPDQVLCPACAATLTGVPMRPVPPVARARVPILAVAAHTGVHRHLVLAWKLAGRRDLEPALMAAMARAGAAVAPGRGTCQPRPIWVVAAPSGPFRAVRGRPGVEVLARGVAHGIARAGHPTRVVHALARRGGPVQHGASARQRTRGARTVRPRLAMDGVSVVVVDDVLTTGSTLAACVDAVRSAGGSVLGAVVLSAAPG